MLISPVSVSGVTMHGLSLSAGSTLEALTLATIILILAIAIIVANLIVVATYLNFKGEYWGERGTRYIPLVSLGEITDILNHQKTVRPKD